MRPAWFGGGVLKKLLLLVVLVAVGALVAKRIREA
jgi:hypothetical protein